MHRPREARALRCAVRREGGAHLGQLGIVDAVVGEGRPHHALLEIGEVLEDHRRREAAFGHLLPGAAPQGLVKRGLRRGAHHALVVEQSHQLVERPGIDRLRYVQMAARAQHAGGFAQRLPLQRPGGAAQAAY